MNKELICEHCKETYLVSYRQWVMANWRKRNKNTPFTCSKKCCYDLKGFKLKQKVCCAFCHTEFIKSYSQIKKSDHHFCSRSCRAKFPRSQKCKITKKCTKIDCENLIRKSRSKFCEFHYNEYKKEQRQRKEDIENRTIGSYRKIDESKYSSKYRHARINTMARAFLKDLKEKPCFNCGYSKHVEMCHIIPVKDFPDDALLKEVNSIKNVLPLCPNCHWEFDSNNLDRENLITKWKKN